jgi:DNA-binding NarL/FixJ family response regulator
MENKTITVTLSEDQISVLKHLELGLTQKEIADRTGIALTRVKKIIYLMTEQFHCPNAVQLVSCAIRNKII